MPTRDSENTVIRPTDIVADRKARLLALFCVIAIGYAIVALGHLLFPAPLAAQSMPATTAAKAAPDTVATAPSQQLTATGALLDYEHELRDATRNHEAFIDALNVRLEQDAFKLGTGTVAIAAAILTWFEVQTRKSLRKHIIDRVRKTINDEVKAEFENLMEESLNNYRQQRKLDIAKFELEQSTAIKNVQSRFELELSTAIKTVQSRSEQHLLEELAISDIVTRSLIELHAVDRRNLREGKCSEADATRTADAIKEVENALKNYPGKRSLVIIRGRFYEEYQDKPEEAIRFLQQSLEYRAQQRKPGEHPGVDDAALLYNIACDATVMWKFYAGSSSATDQEHSRKMRTLAEDSIRESIRLDSSNKAEAEDDADLLPLIDDLRSNGRWPS